MNHDLTDNYPSLILLILITLSAHFLAKNISPPPKSFPFPIHSNLNCAAFPLVILTYFSLNLVSSKQEMSTDLCSNISRSSPQLPLRVPTFALKTCKSTNLLSSRLDLHIGLHLSLVLLCSTSSLWKVPLPFVQFSFSILFVIS